jgi:DNA (cytosine-5)-methyltransferase 1
MRHGSLFSGIGGFDLAAQWMGWENIFHCEWNEFGQKVLKHHFPKSISYADITKVDFRHHRGDIDIISGGFPCQPYSSAGKRLGKEDDRHLWPEMLRCIREVQPKWVVGENVLGLVNWSGGLVFHEVQADLEAQGYEVQPYVLPAASVNAPHRRDRVWFIAYRNGSRLQEERPEQQATGPKQHGELDGDVAHSDKCNDGRTARKDEGESGAERLQERDAGRHTFERGGKQNAPDTDCRGLEGSEEVRWDGIDVERKGISGNAPDSKGESSGGKLQQRQTKREFGGCYSSSHAPDSVRSRRGKDHGQGKPRQPNEKSKGTNWQNFPTQSPLCGGDDGLPRELDGITFPKWRNESIKAYGNAIVPQVALQIFKAIAQYETR